MSEEKPPFYRFVNASEEDRIASEQAGIPQYKDVVYVYIRTPGDSKTELKDYARNVTYDVTTATIDVEKEHTFFRDGEEVTEKIRVPEKKNIYTKKTVHPRLEKLREWVKNGHKSEAILLDYEQRWERFLKKEDDPIVGTPLADWRGANESVKRRAIEVGLNSVEQVAEMDDATIQVIGMGARDMKNKAIAFLDQDTSPIQQAQKMSSMERELAELKARLFTKEQEQDDSLDSKTDDELVTIARGLGYENASTHWKRETLITKIKEREPIAA